MVNINSGVGNVQNQIKLVCYTIKQGYWQRLLGLGWKDSGANLMFLMILAHKLRAFSLHIFRAMAGWGTWLELVYQ